MIYSDSIREMQDYKVYQNHHQQLQVFKDILIISTWVPENYSTITISLLILLLKNVERSLEKE